MEHVPKIKFPQLPFITREMFDWGAKTEFDLEVVVTTAQTITFQVSGATKESPFSYNITPTGNIDRESFTRRIAGIPIFLSVHIDNTNAVPGQMWIEVYLRGGQTRLLKLVAGYIFPERGLSYPAGSGSTPFNEISPPLPENVANPAAGADWDVGPSGSQLWYIHAVSCQIVTDANAASRVPHLEIVDNGGALIMDFSSNISIAASQTRTMVFQPVGEVADPDNAFRMPVAIPQGLIVNRAMDLQMNTLNIQVGDQWSNIRIYRASMALET